MGLDSESQARLGIDAAFIQSLEHRPNAKHCDFTPDQIPLIDLSPLNPTCPPHPTTFDSLVAQIHAACRDWGFFQVINHGISPHLLHTIQSEAANFFSLPMQEKTKVRRDFDNPLGYYDTELTKNVRDWKEVFDFACRGTMRLPSIFELDSDEIRTVTNQWPQNPPGLRSLLIMARHRFPGGAILRNSLRFAPRRI
jgi:isopenicillin N synthase-like dioxygenase